MSNRSFIAALSARLLVGRLCGCGAGALRCTMRSGAVADSPGVIAGGESAGAPESVQVEAPEQATPEPTPTSPPPITFSGDTLAILQAEEQALNAVFENVSRSVVNISISQAENSVL